MAAHALKIAKFSLAPAPKISPAVNPVSLESMLRFFKMDREDSTFTGMIWDAEFTHVEPNKLSATFVVDRKKIQHFGSLHGGYSATMSDCITCAALIVATGKAGVSTNMNISYFDFAKPGTLVYVDAEVLRFDDKLAYTEAHLYKMKDGVKAQIAFVKHIMTRHPKAYVREETDREFNIQ